MTNKEVKQRLGQFGIPPPSPILQGVFYPNTIRVKIYCQKVLLIRQYLLRPLIRNISSVVLGANSMEYNPIKTIRISHNTRVQKVYIRPFIYPNTIRVRGGG